jgi:uncharacterized protein YjbI with pentapeptide repeats
VNILESGILCEMASEEQLNRLNLGPYEWNRWRNDHPNVPVDLSRCDLSHSFLSEANLAAANLFECNLRKADLTGASLAHANLYRADLSETQLRKASLYHAALNQANLTKAILSEANLRHAELKNTNLSDADLKGADFDSADLSEAFLKGANLQSASFTGANLTKAILECNLRTTNLTHADLGGANLSGARLSETFFCDVNLRQAIGLDSCVHRGPSSVDHRTLMRSGPLPLPFLRGCGLPDHFIDYLPSLFGTPIQFYSCFISYSTNDQDFAERLHADLQDKGVRCWFARHKIQGGRKIHEQIDEAIRVYDKLLLILSPASMDSPWVKTEIAHARQKELNQTRRVLFPISLVPFDEIKTWKNFDSDTGKDSAKEIREYFIPDFTDWKRHDSYSKAFERLLRDLKA